MAKFTSTKLSLLIVSGELAYNCFFKKARPSKWIKFYMTTCLDIKHLQSLLVPYFGALDPSHIFYMLDILAGFL